MAAAGYIHAAGHLDTCAHMASGIEHWQETEDHEGYAARLMAGHGRKSRLWSRVSRRVMAADALAVNGAAAYRRTAMAAPAKPRARALPKIPS